MNPMAVEYTPLLGRYLRATSQDETREGYVSGIHHIDHDEVEVELNYATAIRVRRTDGRTDWAFSLSPAPPSMQLRERARIARLRDILDTLASARLFPQEEGTP